MKRIRIGIIGGGAACDWAVLPALSGPDMMTPPDAGAWWGRRGGTTDIAYQPPARVEIVALADADEPRLQRTTAAWRIRAPYTDWRAMLNEVQLDAVVAVPPGTDGAASQFARAGNFRAELLRTAAEQHLPLWLLDVPSATAHEADELAPLDGLWCAHPLRSAAAHRAARRIVESGRIGPVSGITLRWPRALCLDAATSPGAFAASYAAFDLLLWAASLPPRGANLVSPHAARIAADENGGASSLWIRFAHGFGGRKLAATALCAACDEWNQAVPRLEIAGTQGRSIVCEAGKRVLLLEPREAARSLEVPGMSAHQSHSNTLGIAEDLKTWLACLATESGGDPALSAGRAAHSSSNAATTLRLMEAAREALDSGSLVETDLRHDSSGRALDTRATTMETPAPAAPLQPTLRLPLEERW